MDFLDPTSRRNHLIRLFTGYVLVAIAIMLAAFILLMVAYGFGIGKNGQVIQSGLLFVSSQPNGASVYIDGVSNKKTNVRYNLPEGTYDIQLKRAGYRPWQRRVNIEGGKVVRYDYPFLFPQTLTTTTLATYNQTAGADTMATVTPDNRWLLVEQAAGSASFDVYDLKASKPQATASSLTIPPSLYAAGGHQTWQIVSWADDKVHALLKHGYGTAGATEYILLDRSDVTKSVNLDADFGTTPSQVTFINSKYDHYYLYTAGTHNLQTASLDQPAPQTYLSNVLAYDSYQDDTMAYITPSLTNKQAVELRLRQGDKTYTIRQLPAGTSYQVAAANFKNALYVATTAKSSSDVFLYKNPLAQLQSEDLGAAVPTTVLRLKDPTHLSFSVGGRILVVENGSHFITYDNQYKHSHSFTMPQPMDKNQAHATWMDGARLQYVSNGQLYVFDFDGKNAQLLMPALSDTLIFYDPGYKHVYTLTPPKAGKAGQLALKQTWLLAPPDR